MAEPVAERTLEETPTWAVAVVCFVLVVISIFIEHIIHMIGAWLKRKHKTALYESLEKFKAELMLLGFISLLLTVFQGPISDICVPPSIAATWHPCNRLPATGAKLEIESNGRKLVEFPDLVGSSTRRSLAVSKGYDKCGQRGKVAFVSSYGIHQLHIFIFVLAIFHVLYGITTLAFGRIKMRKWKSWEDETKTVEYQYSNDPERFRFTRDTSFGQRHLNFWSKSPVTLWIVCFFRQFFTSVTKTDYLTLRHGFIMAHLAPGSETKFDFQKYICRSLEDDFKVVVSITPLIWLFAMFFLLTNTQAWYSYLWLPFIPLIIILLVGAKLQVIITKMGVRILARGDVVKGAPVVQPGNDLFWFGRPHLMLFLIHFVLFQNAFQLAFFAWSTYEFGLRSCFHQKWEDIGIRISMGVLIQILCSYVTLPLYALVTQMGSTMRPTIFNDRVAAALRNWHRTARRHVKKAHHSGTNSPLSSRPGTPTRSVSPSRGLSPVHLLQNYRSVVDVHNFHPSARASTYDADTWDEYNQRSVSSTYSDGPREPLSSHPIVGESSTSAGQLPDQPRPIRSQHEVNIPLQDFTFGKQA